MKLRSGVLKKSGVVPKRVNRKLHLTVKTKRQRSTINRKIRCPISPILLQSNKEEDDEGSFFSADSTWIQEDEDDVVSSCYDPEYSISAGKRQRANCYRIASRIAIEASANSGEESLYSCGNVKVTGSDDAASLVSNSAAESCLSSLKKGEEADQVILGASTKSASNVEVLSDLACDEKLCDYEDDEDDVVSDYCGVDFGLPKDSDEDDKFYFSSSSLDSSDMFLDTGSEFSVGSQEVPTSPTLLLLIQYRNQFSRSSSLTKSTYSEDHEEHDFMRFEDEEDEESYERLRERERKEMLCYDYGEAYRSSTDYGDLVVEQRSVMVHWIAEHSWKLQPETMFLAVNLLDRFLSKGFFCNKRPLQIAGLACLALAIRVEENQPHNSVKKSKFQVETDIYSRCEVVAMEWLVQEVLNFQCFSPTIYSFLGFYIKASGSDKSVERKAKYLAALAIADHEQLAYWPSTVAASLVILASRDNYPNLNLNHVIEIHVRTKENDLHDCVKSLEWLLQFCYSK